MPIRGETRNGAELGKRSTGRYVWSSCALCGKERWVQMRVKTGKAVSTVCSQCTGHFNSGPNSPNWQGGRYKEQAGYIVVYLKADDFFFPMTTRTKGKPSHRYGGYVQEHRLVMAKHLARCLNTWEIVHHKNGIKDDNRIENLTLAGCIAEHIQDHNRGYQDGYRDGLQDGRDQRIKQLMARIRELEDKLARSLQS